MSISEGGVADVHAAGRLVNLSGLQAAVEIFAREREWERFHSPKNLVMALSGEVGELTEIFQWLGEDASHHVAHQAETSRAVRDELADVLIYLARLAAVLGVDLNEAAATKLQTNALKYPVDKARGHARKLRSG